MAGSPEALNGQAFHLDIERFAHDQLNDHDYDNLDVRAKRSLELTDLWRNTPIALQILEGGVPAFTLDGESLEDMRAEGMIESISVPPGGGVEVKLDNGSCFSLPIHGDSTDTPEECESGWEASTTA